MPFNPLPSLLFPLSREIVCNEEFLLMESLSFPEILKILLLSFVDSCQLCVEDNEKMRIDLELVGLSLLPLLGEHT